MRLNLELAPAPATAGKMTVRFRCRFESPLATDQHRGLKCFDWHASICALTQAYEIAGACFDYLPSRTNALDLRWMFLRIRLMPGTSA